MEQYAGVLTIAHTRRKYAEQAAHLARSIRLRSPGVRLAVATDLPSHAFGGLYDLVIPWDFRSWPGVLCKLAAFEMSPFETTLFIETDCLAVGPVERVFDYFGGRDFAVYGRNEPTTPYLLDPDRVRASIPSPTYPIFNGGLYYFTRTPRAEEVYRVARELLPRYDELKLARIYHAPRRPDGVPCDEPLFSLAMARLGIRAVDSPGLEVMAAPEKPRYQIEIDVLAGACQFVRCGRIVRPILPHFVGARDIRYPYLRETRRLAAAYPGVSLSPSQEVSIRAQAWLQSGWLRTGHSLKHRLEVYRAAIGRGAPRRPAGSRSVEHPI